MGTPTYMVGTCGGKTEKYRGGDIENGRSTLPPFGTWKFNLELESSIPDLQVPFGTCKFLLVLASSIWDLQVPFGIYDCKMCGKLF